MDFYIIAQQIVNGLTLGSIYGLIAVGYTMVYWYYRHERNFAQLLIFIWSSAISYCRIIIALA